MTGTKEVAGVPVVNALVAIAWVAATGPFTTRLKGWLAVAPAASVIAIVKVVAAIVADGVPEIFPVDVFNPSAAGSAGVTAKVYGEVPPPGKTGRNAGAAVVAVITLLAIACTAVSGPLIVRLNVRLATAPTASVPATVNVTAVCAPAGVPVMAPVDGLNAKFAGKAGEIASV